MQKYVLRRDSRSVCVSQEIRGIENRQFAEPVITVANRESVVRSEKLVSLAQQIVKILMVGLGESDLVIRLGR